MAKKSAETYVFLKGNDKAISILQNVMKVIVLLIVARFDASFIHFVTLFQMCKQTNKNRKTDKLKIHQKSKITHIVEKHIGK